MEIKTKEMTITKNFFNKCNDYYYLLHSSQKTTAFQRFKKVSMRYLFNKLP